MIARSQQLVEALGGAGLKLQVGLGHLSVKLNVAGKNRVGGFALAVMCLKDVLNIGIRTADKLMD